MKTTQAKFRGMAVIRDQYGRIVVDDEIFYDEEKLKRLRDEVIKNGSYASGSDPKRDR